jgi:hypothetical protein
VLYVICTIIATKFHPGFIVTVFVAVHCNVDGFVRTMEAETELPLAVSPALHPDPLPSFPLPKMFVVALRFLM